MGSTDQPSSPAVLEKPRRHGVSQPYLASKSSDHLDVGRKYLIQNDDGYNHMLCGTGEEVKKVGLHDQMMRIGEYRIEVTVTADNADTVSKVVSYMQTMHMLHLQELHESEPPLPETPRYPAPGNLSERYHETGENLL